MANKRRNHAQVRSISLPSWQAYRKITIFQDLSAWMIKTGEETNAGQVSIKYGYIDKPWRIIITARRITKS